MTNCTRIAGGFMFRTLRVLNRIKPYNKRDATICDISFVIFVLFYLSSAVIALSKSSVISASGSLSIKVITTAQMNPAINPGRIS